MWLSLPCGDPVENTINALLEVLSPNDIIVDSSNSNYTDSIRRAAMLAERDCAFLDAGISGGVWGLEEGYSLMLGGDKKAYHQVEPILKTLAPAVDKGYGHVGPSGAGHFVKMVHNGIEYGLMQSYAEGFELMQAKQEFKFDLHKIAEIWRHGSVIRSWLLDLVAGILQEDTNLKSIQAYVEDTGEGRWAVKESIDLAVPTPIITQALQAEISIAPTSTVWCKVIGCLKDRFGGHAFKKF